MKETGNIEFIQVCGILQRQTNKQFLKILNINVIFPKVTFKFAKQNKAATRLKRYDVLSGKGFVGQQIFKRFGLNVELLNSLGGNRNI